MPQTEKQKEWQRNYRIKNRNKINEKQRLWWAAHRELSKQKNRERRKKYPEEFRSRHRQRNYGLTLQQYRDKLSSQDFKCAICNKEILEGKNGACLDHCHKTGLVREFLCFHCNRGLGSFFDSPEVCIKASEYLKKHFNRSSLEEEPNGLSPT